MYEDGANIYTELPEVKVAEKRYLVVEYTRNDGSAENWYFYTWNSGFGANVYVPFEEVNGTCGLYVSLPERGEKLRKVCASSGIRSGLTIIRM